ncbi:hypothetical protein NC652_016345 [Populus alba x Populus x berolinensis]|uniref:Uncharacterized protein n=1 Tax=Populus alba x Populus x berolinensis TaxID=444605 RepID=A0AAD6QK41_9ROSI|nr:hypothetical protein NC652_016345 [Populus alba x Populus x berolinensis]KAJ6991775.1 hypothetical protein NC653_015191 [Populus alba x Populus x berolinensis]KAJ6993141.1 hypothetical protein NC653_016312 [Populus alba x Populus x berolinensis]
MGLHNGLDEVRQVLAWFFGAGYGDPLSATLTATGFSPTSCAIPGLMNGILCLVVIVTTVSKMFFNLTD